MVRKSSGDLDNGTKHTWSFKALNFHFILKMNSMSLSDKFLKMPNVKLFSVLSILILSTQNLVGRIGGGENTWRNRMKSLETLITLQHAIFPTASLCPTSSYKGMNFTVKHLCIPFLGFAKSLPPVYSPNPRPNGSKSYH